jgi:hypothetical protein
LDERAFRRQIAEWNAVGKPDAGIRAFDEIEKMLSNDAELQGESSDDSRRIVFAPPLGVIFRTHQDIREVRILDGIIARHDL